MSKIAITDLAQPPRRSFLLVAAMAGAGAIAAPADADVTRAAGLGEPNGDILETLRIADVVQRERSARDAGQWDEMASYWHPRSSVDVSWYQGDGAGFVAASRRNASAGRLSLHQLAPTVAKVSGVRAIAETPCQLLSFVPVDGVDICMVGTVRLLWRAERLQGRWLIAGLRMIYLRDILLPCDPGRVPAIDAAELARYRPSYRHLSYILARSRNPPRDDLPGIDRPETVDALRAGEARWLPPVGRPAAPRPS